MAAQDCINSFTGDYGFLSNFWRGPVLLDGKEYATAEHAFQARKAASRQEHDWVAAAPNAGQAKRRGRAVRMRADWEHAKDGVMLEVLRAKFAPGTQLAERLVATGAAKLVEGNTWNDTYWGVCGGVGHNRLGKLLQQVRAELATVAVGA